MVPPVTLTLQKIEELSGGRDKPLSKWVPAFECQYIKQCSWPNWAVSS